MSVCLKSTNNIIVQGDFLRFYDLSPGNALDDSGERYCHSSGPDFSYNSEIQVLFRSNPDPVVSSGFDCQVEASPLTIPPPRVSSFAQEACTDVLTSGIKNCFKSAQNKLMLLFFLSSKCHLSQERQARPQWCLQQERVASSPRPASTASPTTPPRPSVFGRLPPRLEPPSHSPAQPSA